MGNAYINTGGRQEGAAIEAMQLAGGISMNFHPQQLQLGESVVAELVQINRVWAENFPYEANFAQEHYGVPSVITRTDFGLNPVSGKIDVYEVDDHPVASGIHQDLDPYAKEVYDRMREQLPHPLSRAFMDDGRPYAHDDALWLPMRNPDGSVEVGGKRYNRSLVIARARRNSPGFEEFITPLAADAVMPAWERDNKFPLVALGVGQVMMGGSKEFEDMVTSLPVEQQKNFVVKGLYSSRGEDVAVYGPKNMFGAATMGSIRKRFDNVPIMVQTLAAPSTMNELGLTFTEEDHRAFQAVPERGNQAPHPNKFLPGTEHKYYTIMRIFGVFDPASGAYRITGGLWAARPNIVVHGASDSIFGQVTVERAAA